MSTLSDDRTGPTPEELVQKLRLLNLGQVRQQLEADYKKWNGAPSDRYTHLVSFIRLCETR